MAGDFFEDAHSNRSGSSRKRKKCPPHLKIKIRQRWWGDKLIGECFCCGRKSLHYDDSEVGHIRADVMGGKWSPRNCRLICRTCNSGMGKTNMRTYMRETYPERYNKLFRKEKITTKKTTKKKHNRKARRETGWFGMKV
tara:strand:+ start:4473 stop:4889 length:417 start_codon:yes stop_codon:yes gene_type:complete